MEKFISRTKKIPDYVEVEVPAAEHQIVESSSSEASHGRYIKSSIELFICL